MEQTTQTMQSLEKTLNRVSDDVATLKVYSIKDLKTEQFDALYLFRTDEEFYRALKLGFMINSRQFEMFSRFPQDYFIYHLGYFDLISGDLSNRLQDPKPLIGMIEIFNEMKGDWNGTTSDEIASNS